MATIDYSGIIPPIPTPFKDGQLAIGALQANVEKWCRTGIRGILALGSNGEYVYLSNAEKLEVVRAVVAAAPKDRLIMVGSGCEGTAQTLRLTSDLAHIGAQAALVVTPAYYGGQMTTAALMRHYETVADGSPIPVLLYNVPKFTHINLSPEIVVHLSAHPNIVGIKDSSGNVSQLAEYLHRVPADFSVLVGTAGALYGALSLGCAGGILALANIAPRICIQIFDAVRSGDHETASRLQRRIVAVNTAVTATYGVGGLKAALDMLGYFGGDPRPPLLPPSGKDRDEIRRILAAAELI
jgi:4-hydroxy-2-oxoglutarate aldolase